MEDTKFEIKKTQVLSNVRYEGRLTSGVDTVCICKVNVYVPDNAWSISGWYTADGYKNKGYGKIAMSDTLKEIYKEHGKPDRIEYVWNGLNDYVYNWMTKHFGARQKTASVGPEDDWDSHIYYLNVDKVLDYFEVR
ncbi:MAG: hypothetical protein IJH65_03570 [Methanobrevibacter sp.]|nr:hypothetical protein [Methanobrevibacter sp.]